MKIHFLRHATFVLEVNNLRLLVDPMLSEKEGMDPVKVSRNSFRIPMVDLPVDESGLMKLLNAIDAVIVTHTHRDHWDTRAQQLLRKDIPLICQPSDVETFQQQGFTNILPVNDSIDFKTIAITRTGGQHGKGDIGLKMGHVSGFVIDDRNTKLYIAGDTIWCTEVETALARHKPDFIVLNAGAARFDDGDPITMDQNDVSKVINSSAGSKVINVHMEAVNHCDLTRDQLRKFLQSSGKSKWMIPADGEKIQLTR